MNKITVFEHLRACAEAAKNYASGLVGELAQTVTEAIGELESVKANKAAAVAITIAPGSLGTAKTCGLCATNETMAGIIRVRSTSIPAAEIAAEFWIEDGKE